MEAYLKKLCFEYQVDEREVKELLARMEMVYLDKGETIASATMPEQSLYPPARLFGRRGKYGGRASRRLPHFK